MKRRRALLRNKFGAVKVICDGKKFDSKGEAWLYRQLVLLHAAGQIKKVERQVRFVLYAGIVYIADFVVTDLNDRRRVLDFKGHITAEFRLKKKLFEFDHGKGSLEVVTEDSGWKP